jgi:hypothetical protein
MEDYLLNLDGKPNYSRRTGSKTEIVIGNGSLHNGVYSDLIYILFMMYYMDVSPGVRNPTFVLKRIIRASTDQPGV